MRLALSVYFMLTVLPAMAHGAAEQNQETESECTCTEYPFTPDSPCFDRCAVNIVLTSSPTEIVNALNIGTQLQSKIRKIKSEASFYSYPMTNYPAVASTALEEFIPSESFSAEEIEDLRDAFETANPKSLQELIKGASTTAPFWLENSPFMDNESNTVPSDK